MSGFRYFTVNNLVYVRTYVMYVARRYVVRPRLNKHIISLMNINLCIFITENQHFMNFIYYTRVPFNVLCCYEKLIHTHIKHVFV